MKLITHPLFELDCNLQHMLAFNYNYILKVEKLFNCWREKVILRTKKDIKEKAF